MKLRREHRDRDETEVAVLQALADRQEEGMTLFELRSSIGVDIDELERALSGLQHSGLVAVEKEETRAVFVIDSDAIETEAEDGADDVGFFEWVQKQFGF